MSRRERSALLQKKLVQAKKVTDALPYGEASSTPYLLCLTLSDSLVQRFILNPNKMKKDKEQQMISRAQRPGRTSQLEIHKLFYKNESEYKEMPKELTINNIVLNTNNIIIE